MAFSVGFITYTISKLVSKGWLEPKDTVDEFTFVDTSNEKGIDSNLDEVTYNEKEIAELFDKMMKPDDFDETKHVNPFEDNVEMVKVEKPLEKTIEEIYEEITLTESYLRYGHDFGDLANLRMRNDFVFKAGDMNRETTQENIQDQEEQIKDKSDAKAERARFEQRRIEELLVQRNLAEKYTEKIGNKD